MFLTLTPLNKAFSSLLKGMERAKKNPADLEVRDACIQRFEYTFELAIKMIKRYLQEEQPLNENLDQFNYRDLLRIAAEAGLINQVEPWFEFREARNITSHAYDEEKAAQVFGVIPQFIEQTILLLKSLENKISKNA